MTAKPDHCDDCGKPLAVENDHPGGCECAECAAMCWSSFGSRCLARPMSARIAALEATVREQGEEIAKLRREFDIAIDRIRVGWAP